uniref:Uncharacterized protein n=1 Tax=Cucumis melo TaxID=3656 RepID=A0A9I9E5H8_CUCME
MILFSAKNHGMPIVLLLRKEFPLLPKKREERSNIFILSSF